MTCSYLLEQHQFVRALSKFMYTFLYFLFISIYDKQTFANSYE